MNEKIIKFVSANADTISGALWLLMDFMWMHDNIWAASVFGVASLLIGAAYLLFIVIPRMQLLLGLAAWWWLAMNLFWMWNLVGVSSVFGIIACVMLTLAVAASPFTQKHFGRFKKTNI